MLAQPPMSCGRSYLCAVCRGDVRSDKRTRLRELPKKLLLSQMYVLSLTSKVECGDAPSPIYCK